LELNRQGFGNEVAERSTSVWGIEMFLSFIISNPCSYNNA
jgi:hypothetical protein